MERHNCPLCGRPHNVKQGLSTVQRAHKAAVTRWGKVAAASPNPPLQRLAKERLRPKLEDPGGVSSSAVPTEEYIPRERVDTEDVQ